MSLQIRSEDRVIVLTIDRENAMNALNKELMNSLYDFFVSDPPVPGETAGVIITGAGSKAFVAGADITEFKKLDRAGALEFSEKGQKTFDAIEQCPVPVVAAINGYALGGGCELAMACHLRIASENARFGQPEVGLGLIPGYGGTQRLPRLIGRTKAMELNMTGDLIDARQALELGMLNAVVLPDELIGSARAMLEKIGKKAPLAISAVIQAMNTYETDPSGGMHKEAKEFAALFDSEDMREGVDAFLEKRKADFKGK